MFQVVLQPLAEGLAEGVVKSAIYFLDDGLALSFDLNCKPLLVQFEDLPITYEVGLQYGKGLVPYLAHYFLYVYTHRSGVSQTDLYLRLVEELRLFVSSFLFEMADVSPGVLYHRHLSVVQSLDVRVGKLNQHRAVKSMPFDLLHFCL